VKCQLYYKFKLHESGIKLLAECCKNYKLGIQEIQRFIMYDSLKTVLINENTPFLIKRGYIRLIYETYINCVSEEGKTSLQSDGLDSNEISELIRREILPKLDKKSIFQYLEGLQKISRNNV
jgi:hypothetical protein